MKNRILLGLLAMVLAVSPIVVGGCPPPAPPVEPIKIGVIGPMAFIQGEHHWYGAVMARDEINEAGGVLVGEVRRPIELVKIDSNEILSIPDAAMAMERAITVYKVDFLVGGFRTEAVLAMQDIAMDHRKIFLGCGAAHPELNMRVAADYDRYKYWFRVAPINSTYLGRVTFIAVAMVADRVREELGIEIPRVALMAEKAAWADPVVAAAKELLPKLGMEVAGVWRPSPVATDVIAELTAIKAAGAHIIMTVLSGPVGVPYATQWGELEIPAASVGINVEAQKLGFWEATGGKGNWETSVNFYAPVEITPKSIPFFNRFVERFGEFPIYTAGTYEAIYILKEAIERAGTLDADAVVTELKKTDYLGPGGRIVFMGRDTATPHDVTWGPGYVTAVVSQWQDGELATVWPDGRAALGDERWVGLRYEGSVDYVLPPWMVEYWKGK